MRHPSDQLAVHRTRGPLPNFRRALESGTVRAGFPGGSITDRKTATRWPGGLAAWLTAKWPKVRWILEDAATGATGSDPAVFRAKRDIIDRECDLVFVEYAVNDNGTPPERRARAREGVLRQLLASGRTGVVLVYAFMREFEEDIEAGRVPPSVAGFEVLAAKVKSKALPPALDPHCWEKPRPVPFAEIERAGPRTERRGGALNWIDQVLSTTAPGATLRGKFRGRNLVAGFDFGSASSEVRRRIDGGEWQTGARDRPGAARAAGIVRSCCRKTSNPARTLSNWKPSTATPRVHGLHDVHSVYRVRVSSAGALSGAFPSGPGHAAARASGREMLPP